MTEKKYQKKHNVLPAGRHDSVANPRFRDPVHFQLKNSAWIVCQGFIESGDEGKILHSWVEYGGMALDLFHNYRMPVDQYYAVHRAKNVRKFTKSQCRKLMDNTRIYGPWFSKEEIQSEIS